MFKHDWSVGVAIQHHSFFFLPFYQKHHLCHTNLRLLVKKKKRMMLYNYTHWSTTRKLSLAKGLKTIHVCIPANFFWDISVRFLSWECWDFWRRHDHFRWFPKKSEVFRRRPKSAEGEVIEKTLIHKIRDREEGIVFYSFYTWFSLLTWVWVNIFLEMCQARRQQLTFFNQAWEIGPQA